MNNKMKVVSGIMVAAMATLTVNLIGSKDVHANAGIDLDGGGVVFNESSSIPLSYSPQGWLQRAYSADFNQDGFDDLLACFDDSDSGGDRMLGIYLNQAGKGYVEAWTISEADCGCSIQYGSIGTTDANGDGYPDVLITSGMWNGGDALVFINQLGPGLACNTDLNDDGTVNITDLLVLIADWGDCS